MAEASTASIGVAVDDDGGIITLLLKSTAGRWFGISSDLQDHITYCRGAAATDCDDALSDGYAAASW